MQKMTQEQRELAARNIGIVHTVVRNSFFAQAESYEDLVSIGMVGLCKAAMTFRADAGYKFSTYVSTCIRNEIGMHLRRAKRSQAYVFVSMDAPVRACESDSESYRDRIADCTPTAAEMLEDKEVVCIAKEILGPVLVSAVTGEINQTAAAEILGVSQSYASRIISRKINAVRKIVAR